jgi:hypothetical protein
MNNTMMLEDKVHVPDIEEEENLPAQEEIVRRKIQEASRKSRDKETEKNTKEV